MPVGCWAISVGNFVKVYTYSNHRMYAGTLCVGIECEDKIPTCRTRCWRRPIRDAAGPGTSRCCCRFQVVNRRRERNSTHDVAVCLPPWNQCWATYRGWNDWQASEPTNSIQREQQFLTCVSHTAHVIDIDCRRLSVCPSHAGIVSKRLNISSNCLHCLVAPWF